MKKALPESDQRPFSQGFHSCRQMCRPCCNVFFAQPVDRNALKAEAKRLTAESEALRPETEAIQDELDELKTVRYWVRKVIPDALPTRTADGKPSAAEKLESAQNQRELQDLLDRSARGALHEQQKQERTEMRDERE